MYKAERKVLESKGLDLNALSSLENIQIFEDHYEIKLPIAIRDFYLDLNGYVNEEDMVNLYCLENVSTTAESKFHLPEIVCIQYYFILGDFGFQASFWLLEIVGDDYKLYVLTLGVVSVTEITQPYKEFFLKLLDDPYTVIGLT
jgi:hypothetical protein